MHQHADRKDEVERVEGQAFPQRLHGRDAGSALSGVVLQGIHRGRGLQRGDARNAGVQQHVHEAPGA